MDMWKGKGCRRVYKTMTWRRGEGERVYTAYKILTAIGEKAVDAQCAAGGNMHIAGDFIIYNRENNIGGGGGVIVTL